MYINKKDKKTCNILMTLFHHCQAVKTSIKTDISYIHAKKSY